MRWSTAGTRRRCCAGSPSRSTTPSRSSSRSRIRSVLPAGLLVQRAPPRNYRGVMNPRQNAKALAVAAALAALAGCSGAISAARRSPGTVENNMFKPSLPPAANYGPDPARACPQRGVYAVVQDQLNDRFKGKPTPEPEGRLCAMADTLLGWQAPDNEAPPESMRKFLSEYFGLPLTVRTLPLITTVDGEDDRQIADAVVAPIESFASTAQAPRYGLVTVRLKKSIR